MKKFFGVKSFIIVICIISLVMLFVACSKPTSELKPMSVLNIEDDLLSWDEVENADYYVLKVMYDDHNGYESPIADNKYNIELFKEGKYTFAVKAHLPNGYTAYSNTIEYVIDKDINTSQNESGDVTYKGTGTADDPILISNAKELTSITTGTRDPKDGTDNKIKLYYLQTKDIDLSGVEVSPFSTGSKRFEGYYDGGNHVIRNLVQNKVYGTAAYTHVGIFGSIKNAEIINLTIENYSCNISHVGNSFQWGVLAGYAESSIIDNVHIRSSNININSPSATNYYAYVGLLIGESKGNTINHCSTEGEVYLSFSQSYAGGLVGITKLDNSDHITNCYSTAKVTTHGAGRDAGKIVALANSGGLVGRGARLAKMQDCYYSGELAATIVDGGDVSNLGIGVFGSGNCMASSGRSYLTLLNVYFNYTKMGYSLTENINTTELLADVYAIGGNTTRQKEGSKVFAFDTQAESDQTTFANLDFETEWTMTQNGPRLQAKTATFSPKDEQ